MSENILHITDETFDLEVIKSDIPVLVDFWAAWCGPCKAIAPIIEGIEEEYRGKLKIVKLDVDSNTQTAANFGVRGIPTLILFKQGKSVDSHVGMISRTQLIEFLDKHL